MTQEDKNLLFKELSARHPYGVKLQVRLDYGDNGHKEGTYNADIEAITSYNIEVTYYDTNMHGTAREWTFMYEEVKPYLRPMSTMTEEEKLHMELKFHFSYNDGVLDNVHIFETGGTYDRDGNYEPPTTYREIRKVNMDLILEFIHWLNKKMFDYRKDDEGKTMIEKGLALEAPKGMYNIKEK